LYFLGQLILVRGKFRHFFKKNKYFAIKNTNFVGIVYVMHFRGWRDSVTLKCTIATQLAAVAIAICDEM